jgi:uncharacterized SAM-binding protein YcdF (DUF218 family)
VKTKLLCGAIAVVSVTAAVAAIGSSVAGAHLLSWPLRAAALPATAHELALAKVVVILGGHRSRAKAAAQLEAKLHIPVLVSGKGTGDWPFEAESERMAQTLTTRYGVQPRWVETASITTRENAAFSRCILQPEGVRHIVLVTDAWHMVRARLWFRREGFDVAPYPATKTGPPIQAADFLPSAAGWRRTRIAMHEYGGLAFYIASGWLDSPACPSPGELTAP